MQAFMERERAHLHIVGVEAAWQLFASLSRPSVSRQSQSLECYSRAFPYHMQGVGFRFRDQVVKKEEEKGALLDIIYALCFL
ncbi:unnamed protein product [Amoebophrya sp. A120]|nr:unnamed protein product [Amoebophrya sp. A120]|eukprot:GSA120T00015328001.1